MYADPSALLAAYLADHADHEALRVLLVDTAGPILVSEIAQVEIASAAMAAQRAARIPDGRTVIDRFEASCLPGGPLKPLAFDARLVMPRARSLIEEHALFALDALHLAVALEQGQRVAHGDAIVFVTRDRRQAAAAGALGFTVA